MLYTTFQIARRAVGPALLLGVAAMLRYPGGTALDSTTERYSMSQNFLSDLGMTVAYDGRPNGLGAGLFVASLFLLVVGLGSCVPTLIHFYERDVASRRWSRLAGLCGLLASVAFVGVALTPENRVMRIHIGFTLWAWRIITIGAGSMVLASVRSTMVPRRVTLVWALLTTLLAGYVALLAGGPSVESQAGLFVQVVAQKIAAVAVVLAVLYIALEADRSGRQCA